jgi:hypothetical protein
MGGEGREMDGTGGGKGEAQGEEESRGWQERCEICQAALVVV